MVLTINREYICAFRQETGLLMQTQCILCEVEIESVNA
jgi:hypothetical protein